MLLLLLLLCEGLSTFKSCIRQGDFSLIQIFSMYLSGLHLLRGYTLKVNLNSKETIVHCDVFLDWLFWRIRFILCLNFCLSCVVTVNVFILYNIMCLIFTRSSSYWVSSVRAIFKFTLVNEGVSLILERIVWDLRVVLSLILFLFTLLYLASSLIYSGLVLIVRSLHGLRNLIFYQEARRCLLILVKLRYVTLKSTPLSVILVW